jgi:hypothetical protein
MMTDLKFPLANGLTAWHFDSFDGRQVPLTAAEQRIEEAKLFLDWERWLAEMAFPWSESPSKLVH